MFGTLRANLIVAAVASLLVIPLLPQAVEAQGGGRFRVIVPDLVPTDDSREQFGESVAERVREIFDLDRHVAMTEDEIDDAARDFDLRYNDLDCITARQLAAQLDVPLVMCGEYQEDGDQYQVEAAFYTVPAGEEFRVPAFSIDQNDGRGTAQHILQEFQTLDQQIQNIAWCQQEVGSANWEGALNYCSTAVELSPESNEARYALALTFRELEEWEQSLEHFNVLLDENPNEENYLENAAWVAAQSGDRDLAREYYTRYLEQNPENVGVRITVAHELAQAGDSYGAMTLLEEGMEQEPDNVDLHERYGTYAFRAAAERAEEESQQVAQDSDEPQLSAEVAELYRTAIESYELVLEERGSETRPSYVVNLIRAYRQLDRVDDAVRVGERGTELFPEEASILSNLANAYNEAGDPDAAVETLERALELDPNLQNARIRQGNFLLQAGQVDDAIEALKRAEEAGEQPSDQLAAMVFQHGYSNHIQTMENVQRGLELIEEAKTFDITDEFRAQLNYFHGYALLRRGEQLQEPQTLESAQASLPIFRQAREMVEAGRGHAERTGQDINGLLEPIDTYIEIQEAIIQREGRRR